MNVILFIKEGDYEIKKNGMNIRLSLQILEITENIGLAFLKKDTMYQEFNIHF